MTRTPALLSVISLGATFLVACATQTTNDAETTAAVSSASTTWTSPCPAQLTYGNGKLLKDGNTYFYPDGTTFAEKRNGWTIRYPSGRALKDANGYFFYANGMLLQDPEGDDLHYPTGAVLRSFVERNGYTDSDYFYADGSPLRVNGVVYYANGKVAVSGSSFFAEDGTATTMAAFYQGHTAEDEPYKLDVSVGGFGSLFGPEPGPASTSDWFQLYGRIEPLAGLATGASAGSPAPEVSLHYVEGNYVPSIFVRWTFQAATIRLDFYHGAGPVTCDVTMTP